MRSHVIVNRATQAAIAVVMGVALSHPTIASNAMTPVSGVTVADPGSLGCRGSHWVGSWAAAPSDGGASRQLLADQSLRMIVAPHLGGARVRIRLTNRFGQEPITLGPVTLARQAAGPSVRPDSLRAVTFAGADVVTIPAGSDVVSDPVRLTVRSFQTLAISIAVPGVVLAPTEHYITRQTSYLSPLGSGDQVSETDGEAFTEESGVNGSSNGWYFLAGVDVRAPRRVGSVVTFGDSITDGYEGQPNVVSEDLTTVDRNERYPDFLQRRLDSRGIGLSVLNLGIGGNRLLSDGLQPQNGPRALSRFNADALSQAGVTQVIVMLGINDIGQGHAGMNDLPGISSMEGGVRAEELIDGYRQLIRMAHRQGIRISLGTIAPSGGMLVPTYGNESADEIRREVNRWIRTQRRSDGVVDFDAAVRDPDEPSRIKPAYDGSDHLHFSVAGYRALAGAVNLSELALPRCHG